jgi:glycosyltransferase involved in cell wall biosynthesis
MNKRGNELIRKWRAACHPNTVFHSTYFTFLESKVPQVASVYDMNHERFPERYDSEWGRQLRSQYRAYVARATRVIAISDQTRGDITRYYGVPAEQIDVIPLAVCRDTFKYDQTLKQSGVLASVYNIDRPYLLFVGMRNTAYKNFREFLATFAHSGMGESLLLVVAGADWNDEERLLLGRLNVKDSVRLVVHPDNTVLRNLYSSSLAFVYPSLFEGFGIPLLEAMACETLVLASDTPIFREVGGDAPVYFEPLDPGSMIRAMSQALDPLVRETHIRRGRDRVSQYSWERCARDTYRVYQRVLGR